MDQDFLSKFKQAFIEKVNAEGKGLGSPAFATDLIDKKIVIMLFSTAMLDALLLEMKEREEQYDKDMEKFAKELTGKLVYMTKTKEDITKQ